MQQPGRQSKKYVVFEVGSPMRKNIWRLGADKRKNLNNNLYVVQNTPGPTPIPNISPVPPGFEEEEERAYSMYRYYWYVANTVRTQAINNYEVRTPNFAARSTEEMFHFRDSNPNQETRGLIPFKFTWRTKKLN